MRKLDVIELSYGDMFSLHQIYHANVTHTSHARRSNKKGSKH